MLLLSLISLGCAAETTNCSICQDHVPYAYVQYLIFGPYQIERAQHALAKYCDSSYSVQISSVCLVNVVDRYPDTLQYFTKDVPHHKICRLEGHCDSTQPTPPPKPITDRLGEQIFAYFSGVASEREFMKKLEAVKVVCPFLDKIKRNDLDQLLMLVQKNAKRTFTWYLRDMSGH
jgi:hypothetical protein